MNTTEDIEYAFMTGLLFHTSNFVNTTFVEPSTVFNKNSYLGQKKSEKELEEAKSTLIKVAEYIFQVLLVLFSIYELILISS